MTTVLYDKDADLRLLSGKTVAVLGYGSQGHAHAQNLRDSGVSVVVGLQEGSKSKARAETDGFDVFSVREAVSRADAAARAADDRVDAPVGAAAPTSGRQLVRVLTVRADAVDHRVEELFPDMTFRTVARPDLSA